MLAAVGPLFVRLLHLMVILSHILDSSYQQGSQHTQTHRSAHCFPHAVLCPCVHHMFSHLLSSVGFGRLAHLRTLCALSRGASPAVGLRQSAGLVAGLLGSRSTQLPCIQQGSQEPRCPSVPAYQSAAEPTQLEVTHFERCLDVVLCFALCQLCQFCHMSHA